MPDASVATKYDLRKIQSYERKQYEAILTDIERAAHAARDASSLPRYRRAREDDVMFHGAEIVTLELHAHSKRLRKLCTSTIERLGIVRDWPAASESDTEASSRKRSDDAKFEADYLSDVKRELTAIEKKLVKRTVSPAERETLAASQLRLQFELVWLETFIKNGIRRRTCSRLIEDFEIDREAVLAKYSI